MRALRQRASEHATKYRAGTNEARFDRDADEVVSWVAQRWCALADEFWANRGEYVFDDAFAVLFFVRILYANNVVLARGQYNAAWRLITSYERADAAGTLPADLRAAERFVEKLRRSDEVRECYTGSIPENHIGAILQHYGFPTQLLDFTYSLDVAMYFAEGATDYLPISGTPASHGALYVIPSWACNDAVLTSLPPGIMRPSLQRGIFLSTSFEGRKALETYKYVFRHQDMPLRNGLSNIPFGAAVGVGRYLFPAADPLRRLALSVRAD